MSERQRTASTGSAARPDVDVESLMSTSKILTAVVARSLVALEPAVTLPQLRVLVMISARGTMNLSAVAEGLGVNASNASRTCDRLVRMGLLRRREDTDDRRSIQLDVTSGGRRLLDRVWDQRRRVLEQIVSRMSPADQKDLSSSLRGFVEAAAAASEEGAISDTEGHILRWLV